jgi:hypothetical protein
MEKIIALSERIKASVAKEQFDKAISNFQSEMPEIKKTRPVKNNKGVVIYYYAGIDDAQKQVKPYLKQNELRYSFDVKHDEKFITAICKVSHVAGHTEESSFSVPIGSEQFMTEVQKYGARATFAKRYAFSNALGITLDEDKDGQDIESTQKTQNATGGTQPTEADIVATKKILGGCMTRIDLTAKWTKLSKELRANQELIKYANEIMSNIKNDEKN